jgi:hypothetical protein
MNNKIQFKYNQWICEGQALIPQYANPFQYEDPAPKKKNLKLFKNTTTQDDHVVH